MRCPPLLSSDLANVREANIRSQCSAELRYTGMKTKQRLGILVAICAAVTLAPLAASAQTASPADRTTTTTRTDDRDNDQDYGWIGLAGLLGLAGLMGKKRDRDHDVVRTDVTRR